MSHLINRGRSRQVGLLGRDSLESALMARCYRTRRSDSSSLFKVIPAPAFAILAILYRVPLVSNLPGRPKKLCHQRHTTMTKSLSTPNYRNMRPTQEHWTLWPDPQPTSAVRPMVVHEGHATAFNHLTIHQRHLVHLISIHSRVKWRKEETGRNHG